MKNVLTLLLLIFLISCNQSTTNNEFNECSTSFSKVELDLLKSSLINRYSDKYDESRMCVLQSYFDHLITNEKHPVLGSPNQFDLIFKNYGFKYFKFDFYGLNLTLVKDLETNDVYLFTNQVFSEFEEFSSENFQKEPDVEWQDLNEHPEVMEFNRMISQLEEVQVGNTDYFTIIGLLKRTFTVKGDLDYPYPILSESLTKAEAIKWMEDHGSKPTRGLNENAMYFDAAGMALLEVTYVTFNKIDVNFLMKVYPNDIEKYISGDSLPEFARECP